METFAIDPKPSAKAFHMSAVKQRPLHYYDLLEKARLPLAPCPCCAVIAEKRRTRVEDSILQLVVPFLSFVSSPTVLRHRATYYGSPLSLLACHNQSLNTGGVRKGHTT